MRRCVCVSGDLDQICSDTCQQSVHDGAALPFSSHQPINQWNRDQRQHNAQSKHRISQFRFQIVLSR